MKKKIMSVVTAVMLMLMVTPVQADTAALSGGSGESSVESAVNTDWKAAYTDALTKEGLSQTGGDIVVLRDLDLDGIPELFFGQEYPGYAPVKAAWTFKNGECRKITLPDSAGNGDEFVYVSAVKNAEFYYSAGKNEFRFFGPQTYLHNGAGTDSYVRLMYDGTGLKTGKEIYSISWYEKYDEEAQAIGRAESGYSFGGVSMNKDDFNKKLNAFYNGWKHENSPALKADVYGVSGDDGAKTSVATLWTQDHKWNSAAVRQFMELWMPAAVTTIDSSYGVEDPSPWAASDVKEAEERGFVPDSLKGIWRRDITRQQFCELVVKSMEAMGYQFDNVSGGSRFSDTDSEAVEKAAGAGIINGTGNGRFSPENSIRRQDAAVILYRMAQLGIFPEINDSAMLPHSWDDSKYFSGRYLNGVDQSYIFPYARDAVSFCYNIGLMAGTGNNCFSPNSPYTIEQSAVTMLRLYRWKSGTLNGNIIRVREADGSLKYYTPSGVRIC